MAEQGEDMTAEVEQMWRVHPDARLRLRYWDDECVVYHGAAGNTHRVPQPVGQLLEALQARGTATAADLSAHIDLDQSDVERSLQDMRVLGIAELLA